MPESMLRFELPEEEAEFRAAMDGSRWKDVSYDLDQWLRSKLKHGHSFESPGEALEECRKFLRELMEERNLTFDD